MLVWRPWDTVDDHLITITITPNVPVSVTRTPVHTPVPSYISFVATQTPHDYWLIFNECEHHDQCWTSPEVAAVFYHDKLVPYIEDHINSQPPTPSPNQPEAKLIIGGVNAHVCGIQWLKEFITEYRNNNQGANPPYLAGWHFHLYPEIVPRQWITNGMNGTSGCEDSKWIYYDPRLATVDMAWDAWLEDVGNIQEFLEWYGDDSGEVWITEMGCLNGGGHHVPVQPPAPTPSLTPAYPVICQADGFMYEYVTRMTGWLNSHAGRWIDRYAWYTDYSLKFGAQTQLYSFTPGPTNTPTSPSPTPGGPTLTSVRTRTPTRTPTPTATPGPSPTWNRSALGIFYGKVTPAAAGEFDELLPRRIYLPVLMR